MAYEQRDNSGSVFVNDRKEKDTHPDRTGTALIDGKEYWISAWVKEGKRGRYFSMSFKPKDGGNRRPEPARVERGGSYAEELDDSIPFLPEWRG